MVLHISKKIIYRFCKATNTLYMEVSHELRKVLETIADMTQSSIDKYVYDTVLIKRVNLPADMVQKYLNELNSLGLIEISQRMSTGADFALVNITKEGLRIVKLNQHSLR
jgi:predicted transcriptional regulator